MFQRKGRRCLPFAFKKETLDCVSTRYQPPSNTSISREPRTHLIKRRHTWPNDRQRRTQMNSSTGWPRLQTCRTPIKVSAGSVERTSFSAAHSSTQQHRIFLFAYRCNLVRLPVHHNESRGSCGVQRHPTWYKMFDSFSDFSHTSVRPTTEKHLTRPVRG